jgi:hypothetical protein
MSFNITMLEGLSEATLLTLRSSAEAALLSGTIGTTITSIQTRDLSTTFAVNTTPQQMLQAINYALWKCDPDTYKQPSATKAITYYTV